MASKWDRLGYHSEPEWFGNYPILGNWKTQKYELECKHRDNPESRDRRQQRRTRDYGSGILCFKPCIIFNYLSSHWQRTWRCKGKPKAAPLEGCHGVKPFSWPIVLLWSHSHQAKGRGWICKMLWSPRCCKLRAELRPFEALLVRVGTFLTVCIVPEHFCTHYAPWKSSLLLPCQESHTHILGTSFSFVWIPEVELRGASSFLHGLSEASYLCLPASCANPHLPNFVVVEVLSLGKILVSLPGTSAAHSSWGRAKGKVMLKVFSGTKTKSQSDPFTWIGWLGLFCKGVDQEKGVWHPSPGLGHHGRCMPLSTPMHLQPKSHVCFLL